MTDDQSSRLKQFTWEELESDFFLAVIFRSGRRFLVQRYFEQQLLSLRSPTLENKWRRALFDLLSKSTGRLFISSSEVTLMNEIYSWHLNASSHLSKAREHLDCLLDFDELLQCSYSISSEKPGPTSPSYLLQPITTLDAASRTIGLWKEQRHDNLTEKVSRKKREISPMPFNDSASTGWLQLDSKLVPYIRKQCDRLLSVDYLLKERLISAADDVTLRGFYLPMEVDDIKRFNQLLVELVPRSSSSYLNLKKQSALITLDHLLFRLKRLFFIRSLPSPLETIDDRQVMSFHGGLISVSNQQQRIPFIFIKKQKYIPQLEQDHSSSISTFCVANRDELEYLRLVAFYDYLASEENPSYVNRLLSIQSLVLIPVQCRYHEHSFTSVSLHDFHFHEYQRRTQQQQQKIFAHADDSMSDGWWQPPKQKRPLNHFKLQRPIFF